MLCVGMRRASCSSAPQIGEEFQAVSYVKWSQSSRSGLSGDAVVQHRVTDIVHTDQTSTAAQLRPDRTRVQEDQDRKLKPQPVAHYNRIELCQFHPQCLSTDEVWASRAVCCGIQAYASILVSGSVALWKITAKRNMVLFTVDLQLVKTQNADSTQVLYTALWCCSVTTLPLNAAIKRTLADSHVNVTHTSDHGATLETH